MKNNFTPKSLLNRLWSLEAVGPETSLDELDQEIDEFLLTVDATWLPLIEATCWAFVDQKFHEWESRGIIGLLADMLVCCARDNLDTFFESSRRLLGIPMGDHPLFEALCFIRTSSTIKFLKETEDQWIKSPLIVQEVMDLLMEYATLSSFNYLLKVQDRMLADDLGKSKVYESEAIKAVRKNNPGILRFNADTLNELATENIKYLESVELFSESSTTLILKRTDPWPVPKQKNVSSVRGDDTIISSR